MNFKKIIAAIGAAALSLTVIAPQAAVYATTYTEGKTLYSDNFDSRTYCANIKDVQNCWANQNNQNGVFAPVGNALKVSINETDIIKAALEFWGKDAKTWAAVPSTSSDSLVVEFDYKTSYATADNSGGWFVQLYSGTKLENYKYTIAADVGGKLKYSSDNSTTLNQTVADDENTPVELPRNSETDTNWHKVKITLDSVSQETGAFNATYKIDDKTYSKRITEESEESEESDKICTNLGNTARNKDVANAGAYTGLYFGVAGQGNTVEFDNVKVTSMVKEGALDSEGNKVYLNDPLGRWSFANVKEGEMVNAWQNTNLPGHIHENGTPDGPGQASASMWTGNDTLMLGGQQSKVIKYFDGGAAIPGDKSFVVECDIKQTGGGLFALGLIGDKVKASDNNIYTYAGVSGLQAKLTGMLVGRGGGQGLGAARNNATGIGANDAYMDADNKKVMIPDTDTGWHRYKLYVDATPTNNLLGKVTLEIDGELQGSLDSVGTDTDGKWTGVFFANNATGDGARNSKFAEFKNIKVYEPEIFNIPTENTFKGILKFDVDGQEISAKTPVNVKALVTNTAGVTENPYLVAAEYDKNGMLKKIEVKELELSEFESEAKEKKYELAVPDTSEKGGKIGAFLWTKDLQPIGEPIYINIAE